MTVGLYCIYMIYDSLIVILSKQIDKINVFIYHLSYQQSNQYLLLKWINIMLIITRYLD